MKALIKVEKEVEITHVKLSVAVRYDEEDIPNDFPFRDGDMWNATIDIDSGLIIGYPKGKPYNMHMKICDQGSYWLLDGRGNAVLSIEDDYVPNNLIPGSYGDYIELNIDEEGYISNWPKEPSISDFTDEDD